MHKFKKGDVVMIVSPLGEIGRDHGKIGVVEKRVWHDWFPYDVDEGDDIWFRDANELYYIGRL